MSSEKNPKLHRTLTFRLNLLFGGILALFSLLCFAIFYIVMVSVMREHTDSYLLGQARKSAELLAAKGVDAMVKELTLEVSLRGSSDMFFRAFDSTGRQIASSDLTTWQDIPYHSLSSNESASSGVFENWSGSQHRSNARTLNITLSKDIQLQIGQTTQDDVRVIQESRRIMSLITAALILFGIMVTWITVKKSLGGIEHLTNTARKISGDNLQSRVPVTNRGDEIDQLAVMFNDMLDRLETIMQGMKQTNDNIAHELRSPITKMRGFAETTLLNPSSTADYRHMAVNTVKECDQLLGIINTMLDIAEAEAKAVSWSMREVDLGSVIHEACELYDAVADQKHIKFRVQTYGSCMVCGDIRQLQRAVANLVDNAVKYSPSGAAINVEAIGSADEVVVTIINPGPGILANGLPHIFDRFYRGSESHGVPGNGLGLSLALAIVRAHGGTITASSRPGLQTTFTVRLPAFSVRAENNK